MFRSGFKNVLQKSQTAGAVDKASFSLVNKSLHHHHNTEDAMWFPGFRRRHPELKPFIDVLESDHARLVLLETRVLRGEMEASARLSLGEIEKSLVLNHQQALDQFCSELFDHLNREEMLSVPYFMDGTAGL